MKDFLALQGREKAAEEEDSSSESESIEVSPPSYPKGALEAEQPKHPEGGQTPLPRKLSCQPSPPKDIDSPKSKDKEPA